jgi:hypothetical protein
LKFHEIITILCGKTKTDDVKTKTDDVKRKIGSIHLLNDMDRIIT